MDSGSPVEETLTLYHSTVNYPKLKDVSYSKQEDISYRSQQEEIYFALPENTATLVFQQEQGGFSSCPAISLANGKAAAQSTRNHGHPNSYFLPVNFHFSLADDFLVPPSFL